MTLTSEDQPSRNRTRLIARVAGIGLLGGLLGLVVGVWIATASNCAQEFEWGQYRGYEAKGFAGGLAGLALGLVSFGYLGATARLRVITGAAILLLVAAFVLPALGDSLLGCEPSIPRVREASPRT